MTAAACSLPLEFSDLERFAAAWARSTTDERHHQRQTASFAEIRVFYDAMKPRLPEIFDYLDALDLATLPAPARNLLHLSFGFVEAALAVEVYETPNIPDAPYPHGLRVTRELHRQGGSLRNVSPES